MLLTKVLFPLPGELKIDLLDVTMGVGERVGIGIPEGRRWRVGSFKLVKLGLRGGMLGKYPSGVFGPDLGLGSGLEGWMGV